MRRHGHQTWRQYQLCGIDILVNNAVIRYFHPIETFRREEWQHALAVKLSAPFYLTQNVLPGMRAGVGPHHQYFIGNGIGCTGRAGRLHHDQDCADRLDQATAAEMRDTGDITCNAICPTSVLTPNSEKFIHKAADEQGLDFENATKEYLARRHQPQGFILPERLATLVIFLCQPDTFDITGAAIPSDHGRSAFWLEDS